MTASAKRLEARGRSVLAVALVRESVAKRRPRPVGVAVDSWMICNYGYYMTSIELKVTRIGNSRGVRIPAATLERYEIGATVIMEERSDGILLRPAGEAAPLLSWEETARAMEASDEDWSEWDATLGDGLEAVPWEPTRSRQVAEPKRELPHRGRRKK